jgi:hypothetical protein
MSIHRKIAQSRAFHEAVTIAAEAQRAVASSAALSASVRADRARRAMLRERRGRVLEAARSLRRANDAYVALQAEVEACAHELHRAGAEREQALAIIKGRVRFTLYDSRFAEHEAEAVVEHVSRWVADSYRLLLSA